MQSHRLKWALHNATITCEFCLSVSAFKRQHLSFVCVHSLLRVRPAHLGAQMPRRGILTGAFIICAPVNSTTHVAV